MKFDYSPKIILANTTAIITIKSLDGEVVFDDSIEYTLNFYPCERKSPYGAYDYQPDMLIKPKDNKFVFKQYFPYEQEHKIIINNPKTKEEFAFRFYSLEADLFYLNPYKGDLHMHSSRSDGFESPELVTANCRKIGYDFMAITDHHLYYPSKEAKDFYKDLTIDMLICNGEEVHAKDNNVHIINFGGNFSINDFIRDNLDTYYSEVKNIETKLDDIKDDKSRFEIASSIWLFDKIREGNGLAIFCHPYWMVYQGYYVSDEVTTYMLDNQPYDAYEVVGGYMPFEEESNTLQISRYYNELAKGKEVPIVGVSDAHGCYNGLFGWFYTITLAPSNSQIDIINSIKSCLSVAVENIPNEGLRPIGPFRLVKYVLFLTREYFPLHDQICKEEGDFMIDYINKDTSSINKLEQSSGRVNKLIKKIFNR